MAKVIELRPAPRVPRIRQVDEGEWVAMPHITALVAITGTAVSILLGWGAWELGCWAFHWFFH